MFWLKLKWQFITVLTVLLLFLFRSVFSVFFSVVHFLHSSNLQLLFIHVFIYISIYTSDLHYHVEVAGFVQFCFDLPIETFAFYSFCFVLLNMVVVHHCFRLSLWTVCWKFAIVGEINRNRNPINYNVFDSSEVGLDLFRTSSRSDFQQCRTKVSGRG